MILAAHELNRVLLFYYSSQVRIARLFFEVEFRTSKAQLSSSQVRVSSFSRSWLYVNSSRLNYTLTITQSDPLSLPTTCEFMVFLFYFTLRLRLFPPFSHDTILLSIT